MTNSEDSLSDEELACETQAGSLVAFEELVYRYERRVLDFLRCRVRSVHDAQDLAQGVFVRAYHKIDRYNPRYRFATWLFTIARRESVNHFRRTGSVDVQALPGELFDRNDPSRVLALSDARERLWVVARHGLSESQFAALYLYAAEQMSVAEIARSLKKTQTHVKVLLHRARRHMVKQLAEGSEELAAMRDTAREVPNTAVIRVAQAELQC